MVTRPVYLSSAKRGGSINKGLAVGRCLIALAMVASFLIQGGQGDIQGNASAAEVVEQVESSSLRHLLKNASLALESTPL